jgi:hypothetical protein
MFANGRRDRWQVKITSVLFNRYPALSARRMNQQASILRHSGVSPVHYGNGQAESGRGACCGRVQKKGSVAFLRMKSSAGRAPFAVGSVGLISSVSVHQADLP